MAILFALAYKNFFGSSALTAMRTETRARLRQIENVLIAHRDIRAEYPDETEGLEFLTAHPNAPDPSDLWGMPIRYTLVHGEPVLTSAAQDMKFGTKDDIVEKR